MKPKAYLTVFDEPTADIAASQLERFGFEVARLDGAEPWIDKYRRFLDLAGDDDCLRLDADFVPNRRVVEFFDDCAKRSDVLMAQGRGFCFYANDLVPTCPVFYNGKSLEIIRGNFDRLDRERPEASAWRLPIINSMTWDRPDMVLGMHGFFQGWEQLNRASRNKTKRKQTNNYDFELAIRLLDL